jgi:tetratricopeptide (TPR) repeat protein
MRARRYSRLVIVALWGLVPVAGMAAEPDDAAARVQAQELDQGQLERRFTSVGTLIEKSTAARQIESSGDAPSRERHTRAKAIYQEAEEVFKAGDLHQASKLLSDASIAMFEAVRLAAPEDMRVQKSQADFSNKLESVKALLAAQKRISTEKPDTKGIQESTRQIESLLAEAQQQAAANRIDQARATLERAYLMAKAGVSSMRTGDTLVRSLNFATKAEEYHYEIDRNDTHQMLIKVLLEDKQGRPEVDGMVRDFLERAGTLRGQAEAAAARGDHDGAVKLLENSTSELVKAIRNAGVYIPG